MTGFIHFEMRSDRGIVPIDMKFGTGAPDDVIVDGRNYRVLGDAETVAFLHERIPQFLAHMNISLEHLQNQLLALGAQNISVIPAVSDVVVDRRPVLPEWGRFPPVASPAGVSQRPLIEETLEHQALKVYRDIPLSFDRTIVLIGHVIDGIGDLEHMIHAARRVKSCCQSASDRNIKVQIWIDIERSEQGSPALLTKLETLYQILGKENVYGTGLEGERSKIPREWDLACIIGISNGSNRFDNVVGFIPEYLSFGKTRGLSAIQTGLCTGTMGVWISDDDAFYPSELSMRAKMLLFGAGLSDDEINQWDVGFTYMRSRDVDQILKWSEVRLKQMDKSHHAVLVGSLAEASSRPEFIRFARKQKFTQCEVIDREGNRRFLYNDGPGRRLRIICQYIDDRDFPAVLRMASSGTLGGSGDTSLIRGVLGMYPAYVYRFEYNSRKKAIAQYLKSRGFSELSKWFEREDNITNWEAGRSEPISEKVVLEWRQFRSRFLSEMDIGPWIDLYIRRCLFAGGEIEHCERDLFEGRISLDVYAERVRTITSSILKFRQFVHEHPRSTSY